MELRVFHSRDVNSETLRPFNSEHGNLNLLATQGKNLNPELPKL